MPTKQTVMRVIDSDSFQTASRKISDLQRAQRQHDELCHSDILALDTSLRTKHMTLHNAKYTGRFLTAIEDGDTEMFSRTMTDAFVISLSTANIFAQDLAAGLSAAQGESPTLQHLGGMLSDGGSSSGSFLRTYAMHTSEMAKACESLDHLEDYPFRQVLTKSNKGIFFVLLAESASREIDIESAYAKRIADIEENSPHKLFYGE